METRVLYMYFIGSDSKEMSVSVPNPALNLIPEEVETAMGQLIEKAAIVGSFGQLPVSVKGAKIVTRITDVLEW